MVLYLYFLYVNQTNQTLSCTLILSKAFLVAKLAKPSNVTHMTDS